MGGKLGKGGLGWVALGWDLALPSGLLRGALTVKSKVKVLGVWAPPRSGSPQSGMGLRRSNLRA